MLTLQERILQSVSILHIPAFWSRVLLIDSVMRYDATNKFIIIPRASSQERERGRVQLVRPLEDGARVVFAA